MYFWFAGSVELAGFKSNLEEVKQNIKTFLMANVIIKEHIPLHMNKIHRIKELHGEELNLKEMQNQENHVKIYSQIEGDNSGFVIEGNQEGFEVARKYFKSLVERIHDTQEGSLSSDESSLSSDESFQSLATSKMSTSHFSQNPVEAKPSKVDYKTQSYITHQQKGSSMGSPCFYGSHQVSMPVKIKSEKKLQNKLRATRRPSEDEASRSTSLQATSYSFSSQSSVNITKKLSSDLKLVTAEGMTIVIRQGDITRQHVDAIVNPSDSNLTNAGGAAKAIMSAAGPQLRVCIDGMRNRFAQPLQVTECIVTPGFKLSCLKIIHAVGPVQTLMSQHQFQSELYQTFQNCLLKAEEYQIGSLAMPLIGSGAIGAPKKDCADALVRAILEFSRRPNRILSEVHLVNIDSEASEALKVLFVSSLHIMP